MASFRGYFLPKERDWNEDEDDSEVESESDDRYLECKDILNTTSRKYQFYRPSKTPENLKELYGQLLPKRKKFCACQIWSNVYVPLMDGWDHSE